MLIIKPTSSDIVLSGAFLKLFSVDLFVCRIYTSICVFVFEMKLPVCVCVCVCVCVSVIFFVCVCMCLCLCVCVCLPVFDIKSEWAEVYKLLSVRGCVCVWVCVCVCVCMSACV